MGDPPSQADMIEIVSTMVSVVSGLNRLPTSFQTNLNVDSPLSKLIMELTERGDREEAIGGDLNFSICRILVGVTEIHKTPRYESKIQFIEEILEYTSRKLFTKYDHPTGINTPLAWGLGVLACVSKELYRRYGVPYEDIACGREDSGDIMD